jgi:hypothetical protein
MILAVSACELGLRTGHGKVELDLGVCVAGGTGAATSMLGSDTPHP